MMMNGGAGGPRRRHVFRPAWPPDRLRRRENALWSVAAAAAIDSIQRQTRGRQTVGWPDAATTPFCSEKNTNREGAFRAPAFIRWPGHIEPESVSNEIVSGLDWLPTLLAAALPTR
jgi:arylsulfatase A-like enzyme